MPGPVTTAAVLAAAVSLLAACGSATTPEAPAGTLPGAASDAEVRERLDDIDAAVTEWREAVSLDAAGAAAEVAANLVVGPNGPGYGDRNSDGVVGGAAGAGLLSGIDGTPPGLATALAGAPCVDRDVLGGTWTDPGAEWAAMVAAIEAWRPGNNTMPTLASHPMRIVGWATFTLRTDSLDDAHEYGGHASLHVDVSRRALDC